MKKNILIWTLFISFCVAFILILTLTLNKHHNHSYTTPFNAAWNNSKPWKTLEHYYDNINFLPNNTMNVSYAQGTYQDSGGFKFYVTSKTFPAESICISYEIYVPHNFTWVKGGKLPGVWIGDTGANGGNHIQDGFSSRFMWRANGTGEVYVYAPLDQYVTYSQLIIPNGQYGDSMWRGSFTFLKDQWNNLEMCIKLNAINTPNGYLKARVNNHTEFYGNMVWRHNTTQKINGLMMHSFFGGNDETWAPPQDVFLLYRGFRAY